MRHSYCGALSLDQTSERVSTLKDASSVVGINVTVWDANNRWRLESDFSGLRAFLGNFSEMQDIATLWTAAYIVGATNACFILARIIFTMVNHHIMSN